MVSREIEAAEWRKINVSKNNFKDSQISKTNEGHLPIDLQTIKNVTQSLDGGHNSSTPNIVNPCLGESLVVVALDAPQTSKLSKDFHQLEKVRMPFQDPLFSSVGETSGSNNTALKNAKQEDLFDHIDLQNDFNMDLGFDYDEFMSSGFDLQSPISLTNFVPNG